jgi:hypothetical protein
VDFIRTNVPGECGTSIFRVERISELGTIFAAISNIVLQSSVTADVATISLIVSTLMM